MGQMTKTMTKTMISFINKYLPIVSIKLYVYDCGKWPEPNRNVQKTKDF